MNVGILTYHNTHNCGAFLQVYALQQMLNEMGIDNKVLDYRCEKIEETYRMKHVWEAKSAKELVKWAMTIRAKKSAYAKFMHYRTSYLALSEVYDKSSVSKANEQFDAFITGSDQVWNFRLNGGDCSYLLDFVSSDNKRISYAASMGSRTMNEDMENKVKEELHSFCAVSVRENPLAEYIERITGVTPAVVLDPTLLLHKEQYDFPEPWEGPNGKYIFVYTIAPTPNIDRAARELSQNTGLPIIWGHMSYKKKTGVTNVTDLGPSDFINYIKHAEYVLTSSFHGMAFSIIHEKQFFYDLDVSTYNNNSRLETLADLLALQGRELKVESCELHRVEPIDYGAVGSKLDDARKSSVEFLKQAMRS